MDINLAFNNVINYVEENMCNEIDYEKAAEMLGTSSFHFQRMFSFLVGIPIAEYIRRRRMTLAAFDLQKSKEKVIDIAFKYGYQSHSSFTRAFQQFHGITPTVARNEGVSIQVYPQLHLQVTVKGIDVIGFRVVKTAPYQLFGKEDIVIPMEHKYAHDFIREYGESVVKNGSHSTTNLAAGFPSGEGNPFHLLHGIFFKEKDNFTHFMYGWELPENGVEEGFTIVDVPETNWCVFTYRGEHMEGLPQIWTYIYSNWLLSSGYKTGDHIIIEKETWLDEKNTQFCAEVWLPITVQNPA